MNNVNDITENFGTLYHPKSALVFYQTKGTNTDMYVEHFDMDKNGTPVNAHPLTVNEAKVLAKALHTDKEKDKAFLKPKGILQSNILHVNQSEKGTVLWYTKAQHRQLYFVDGLGIPSGKAQVPPMLWFAIKTAFQYLLCQAIEDPQKKRFCIMHHFSMCMKTATFVWERQILIFKIRLPWKNL